MTSRLLLLLSVLPLVTTAAQTNESFTRTLDVIYGRKSGTALTLDVFTPTATNGMGILWIVSAGYGSSHEAINPKFFRAPLARGYTVFAVVHGSAPKFSVPDMTADMELAVDWFDEHLLSPDISYPRSRRRQSAPSLLHPVGESCGV